MTPFYINLDSAHERRDKFISLNGNSYERWRATTKDEVPQEVLDRMLSNHLLPYESHRARCACFLSHQKLLQYIVDNKIDDVLILEDDAIPTEESIPIHYPRDSIVYLGGFIHSRKMREGIKDEVIHQKGIQCVCPQKHRMLGCLSYIIPHHSVASMILNKIASQKRYKAIDIMLGNIGIKQYYNYPPSFIEDKVKSQIIKKNKWMNSEYQFTS